ncbi:CocE/NonD family hydrolase [Paenibacillus puerhi]|uniref:CocE/NonD family hydrolase n=1 Tax=Paenibacillus puerhi TaxID=2692622 RepID=UPI001356FE5F|nr:CocE/NonD family hydrolase [Paenibacillus puerhi]
MNSHSYYEVKVDRNVPIAMRDGVELRADIYTPVGKGTFPVLLMRLPYDKSVSESVGYMHPEWYARQGYLVVTQDVRGRYASDGEFKPFYHERQDGVDTIRFVRELPQSNGKVGMYGFSYVGATQLHPAMDCQDELTAIAPGFTNDGYYEDWMYKNGALHLAFVQSWATSLAPDIAIRQSDAEAAGDLLQKMNQIGDKYGHLPIHDHPGISKQYSPFYYEWLEHPTFDDYWKQWDLRSQYDRIQVPALHIGGWYDIFIEGTIRNYMGLAARHPNQKLLIGPWLHYPWSSLSRDADYGDEARNVVDEWQIRWFDYWLKGEDNGIMEEPAVHIFVMGDNVWRQEREWPLARTQYTNFYLHSDGSANSLSGSGTLDTIAPDNEPCDIYAYNPLDPVPSLGGNSCCVPSISPMGARDQRPVEIRNDVLVYTTPVLEEDVEVTGPVRAVLYASSSADDTDFTVKLVDVRPDGKAINITQGIQRASYRDSNEQPSPIEPDAIYKYDFHVGSTSNVFKKNHRIRIEISSSNFPLYERSLNTFRVDRKGGYTDFKVATQKIYHDAEHPTHIVLPLIPRNS